MSSPTHDGTSPISRTGSTRRWSSLMSATRHAVPRLLNASPSFALSPGVDLGPRELPEGPAPPHGVEEAARVEEPLRDGGGHDLVREDGPVVRSDDEGFDLPREGAPGDRARLREVVLVRRQDEAVGDLADPVAGPPDPLDEARDLPGAVVLEDEVRRPDVDPELEGGRRD